MPCRSAELLFPFDTRVTDPEPTSDAVRARAPSPDSWAVKTAICVPGSNLRCPSSGPMATLPSVMARITDCPSALTAPTPTRDATAFITTAPVRGSADQRHAIPFSVTISPISPSASELICFTAAGSDRSSPRRAPVAASQVRIAPSRPALTTTLPWSAQETAETAPACAVTRMRTRDCWTEARIAESAWLVRAISQAARESKSDRSGSTSSCDMAAAARALDCA
jgi:hypothetical protein